MNDSKSLHPGWVRYLLDDGVARLGVRNETGIVPAPAALGSGVAGLLERDEFLMLTERLAEQEAVVAEDEVTLLPPLDPGTRIFCVAKNYRAHAQELGEEAPEAPAFFTRFPGSIVGHGQSLVCPTSSECYDYEGELAVLIGRPGWQISADDALAHVAAYACFNDGSIRDFQRHSYTAGKNFDDSGSMGPVLVPAAYIADPQALQIATWLNDEPVQQGSTAQMIHPVAELIAYLSQITRLRSGDVISTGTPHGVGWARNPPLWLRPGDRLRISIEGVGTLQNDVVAAE